MFSRLLVAASLLTATQAAALDNNQFPPGGGPGGFEFEPQDPQDVCENAIDGKYGQLLNQGINLGAAQGPATLFQGSQACFQVFAAGRIYTTAPAGGSIHPAVFGQSLATFAAQGFHTGPLGRPLLDNAPTGEAGVSRQVFLHGFINHHPAFGSTYVVNPVSSLWFLNGAEARFGHPITNPQGGTIPGATFSVFDNGYGAQIPGMGAWMDYTGVANEGQITGTVTAWQESGFWGNTAARGVSSQAPAVLSAQVGLNNVTSSVVLAGLPARSSVFFFDGSPLSGRHVQVSGADNASVRVSYIGAWMNDRISSFIVANHGTASIRLAASDLRGLVQTALDALDTSALMDAALEGRDASGSLSWQGDAIVDMVPGERLVHISRRAYMNINADCALVFNCNGDGPVQFDVWLRPVLAGQFAMHAQFVRGTATSISCDGRACGDRAAALATLFNNAALRGSIETTVDEAMNAREGDLQLLSAVCDNAISVRRIHVLPAFIEVVLADTAAAGACAAQRAGNQVSTARPAGRVENSDGTVITTGVTIVPNGRVVFPIGGAVLAR